MDTNNADILQIKKYLEGKLDSRAMHELERRAMDDPFLMDALEGYEAAGTQSKAVIDLNATLQNRLQQPKKGRVISMSALAMAASILAVLTAGGWWFFSDQSVEQPNLVTQTVQDKTNVAPSPLINEPEIAINKDSLLAVNTKQAVIRSPRNKKIYRQPAELDDVNVSADETTELASSVVYGTGTLEEVMSRKVEAKADSVPLNEMLVMGMANQRKRAVQSSAGYSAMAAPEKEYKGRVISAADGEALPGVIVRAGNTGNVAVTGADGGFTLKLDSLNTALTYNYIGFRSKKVDVNNNLSPNTVALEPESASLNEVVVVATGVADTASGAHPKNGWENYQKYLNANSVSPNGKKGTYRVSFTVESDGTLTNFQINKAENDAAGQKAIQLIKNGPEWIGNTKKNEKKVITVKFKDAGN